MKKMIFGMLALLWSASAFSGYNANFSGQVTEVLTYTNSTKILVKVSGMPTTHPECTSFDYMIIDAATPDNVRQIVLSRLLIAYTTGESVNIGYDKEGGCVGNRIKIYRIG